MHAYMIATNNNFKVLKATLELLDDARNDIYILFDKKAKISTEIKESILSGCKKSKVYILPDIIINWGGWSQIEATLSLLKAVNNSSCEYKYVHFFQGSDMPIKKQNQIHEFFNKMDGYEFVMIEKDRGKMAYNKTHYRHFFCHNRFFRHNKLMKALNFGLVSIQKFLHIETNNDIEMYQGSALFSITGACAKYVQSKEKEIYKRFRYSLAGDECFIQSILMNSDYASKIAGIDKTKSSNARIIDRSRPDGKNSPHVWRLNELSYIFSLPDEYCFARKFDERIDGSIIEKIRCELLKK